MKKSEAIFAEIQSLAAKAQAILDIATEENRELSADEQKEINAIHGENDGEGQLAKLEASLKQAEKIEARSADIEARQKAIVSAKAKAAGLGENLPGDEKKIVVPAQARRHASLKAFSGPNAEEDAYRSGQFFAATLFGSNRATEWCKDHGVDIQNAMVESDNAKGGIFVPVETETAIIRQVEAHGVFRQNAQITSMGSDVKREPVRVEGMTAYPVGEREEGTESEPGYKNIELVARKWKVLTKISDDLNEDSLISMAEQITLESALAFAYAEDNAGFNGDGTSTYHGIKGLLESLAAGSIHTAADGNTSFGELDLQDFINAIGKLPDYAGMQPAWFISKPGYFASMARLEQAAGGNTQSDVINGNKQMQFLGYPVIWAGVLNKTLTAQASTVLGYFGDLRMTALFGDRRGVTMSTTDQRYWDEDTIGIKSTERFDIKVFSPGTATAAGPLVAIKTPAS